MLPHSSFSPRPRQGPPLKVMIYPDSSISELHIPLPPPLSHIRVTAPRPSDLEARLIHLNTNEISDLLRDPPWPYPRTLAEERLAKDLGLAQDLLNQYTAGTKHGWFDGCPFRAIREVKEDGSDECIGDIFSARVTPGDAWLDGDEPLDNLTRPVGDAGIWWTIGMYLAPSHHRQGIMSAVLKALLKEWMVPKMNCQTIWVANFPCNEASLGTFVKNGFKVAGEKENAVVHRGEWRTIRRLRWKLEEQDSPALEPMVRGSKTGVSSL